MSTHTESVHEHTEAGHGHGGAAIYLKTLVVLFILTAITVGAAYIDFGAGNVVIALFIATIKATLVALIFMHLLYEKPVNAVIACAGFLFLGIFLLFCLLDFDARVNLQPFNLKPPVLQSAPAAGTATPGAPAQGTPPPAAEKK
jgi:cytochrome c oxidase subunit 4